MCGVGGRAGHTPRVTCNVPKKQQFLCGHINHVRADGGSAFTYQPQIKGDEGDVEEHDVAGVEGAVGAQIPHAQHN